MTKVYIHEPAVRQGLRPPVDWLFKHFLPANLLICVKGLPGAFKTFIVVTMACCIATGLPFLGKRTKVRKVLFIAADDPDAVEGVIQAWIKQHREILEKEGIPLDLPNLRVLKKPVDFYDPDAGPQAIEDFKDDGFEVVIIDTLVHSAIGADLQGSKDPPVVMARIKEFMEGIGAKSGVLVHHSPKDGKGTYGSVFILASVSAIVDSEKVDKVTAKISCERMRRVAFFDPFNIILTPIKVEVQPDEDGVDEEDQLVIIGSAPAKKQSTKDEEDLFTMQIVLELKRKNKATYKEWCDAAHDHTTKKKVDEDGKMVIVKEGWSQKTFDRRLIDFKDKWGARLVQKGDGQGATYTLLSSEEWEKMKAQPATVQPEASQGTTDTQEKAPSEKYRHRHPSEGVTVLDGAFVGPPSTVKHRQNENDGGSRESRNGENPVESPPSIGELTGIMDDEPAPLNEEQLSEK
jgi:hypothetical protein